MKRAWLYVGKVKPDTTPVQVETYLKEKYPVYESQVTALPKREEASSVSFKVGADSELMEQLYKSDNWPAGMVIKKSTFFEDQENFELPDRVHQKATGRKTSIGYLSIMHLNKLSLSCK